MRVLLALHTAVINTDGPAFLTLAQAFMGGDLDAATRKEIHPVYPALVALGGGSHAAGIFVSIAAGVLAGIPLFLLMRELAGRKAALISVAIYEVHPEFLDIQSQVYQDPLFMLVALTAAYGAIRFVHSGRGIWAAAIAAAIGWCAKSEGMIVALLAAVTVGWGLRTHRPWRQVVPAALVALLIVGGFVAWISHALGRLTLSPKSNANQMVGLKQGHDLPERGTWRERREKHGALVASVWYVGVYGAQTFRLGWLAAVLAALAFAGRWTMEGRRWFAAWVLFYFFCVWFTNFKSGHSISNRYLNPPVALSLALLGPALLAAWEGISSKRLRTALVGAGAIAVIASSLRYTVVGRGYEQLGWREAGEWIRARKPGAVVASSNDKTAYYAGVAMVALDAPSKPDCDFVAAEQDERGWKDADFAPLVHLATFPAVPEKRSKIVRVYGRAP